MHEVSIETLAKSCNTCWVWSSMPNLLQNNKVPISWRRVELFCLFTAFSYISMDATVLPCHFSWVWSCKVLWNNKSPVSLGRAKWFCWFFACSYLYLLKYLLKLQKYAQLVRLSDVLNLKNLKTIWVIKLLFCFSFNLDSLHARLNSHQEAQSYKKKKPKRLKHTGNLFRKCLQLKDVLIVDLKPLKS